ncbi:MAG: hypothetical protein AAF564_24300 [Bacteroidota bacterium]
MNISTTTQYALLFGLLGGVVVIGLIQFMLPDLVRIIPYMLVVVLYLMFMKSKAPSATLRHLALGSTLMAFVATAIVYIYIWVFFWQSPANNPLGQTIPVLDHVFVLALSVLTGGAVGTLIAFFFNPNWRTLRRA